MMWRLKLREAARLLASDIKKSRYALSVIAAYLPLKKFFLNSACPVVMLTGLPCPACGLTRAGIALLRGDINSACRLHPFIFAVLLWGIVFLVWRYLLKREIRQLKKLAIVTLAAMAVYYIYRMVRYFPGDAPMSYYYNNVMSELWGILQRCLANEL